MYNFFPYTPLPPSQKSAALSLSTSPEEFDIAHLSTVDNDFCFLIGI